jgi:hypothetical protein
MPNPPIDRPNASLVRDESRLDRPASAVDEKQPDTHALDPVLALARDALELHRARDRDYTAVLSKRLRLAGKLGEQTRMRIKLRSRDATPEDAVRPIDVYLYFLEPKSQAGREVIWRQGENGDRLRVHEAGLLNLMTVDLAPTSRLAMRGNRYPIHDVGIERLLVKLIERGTWDRGLGPCEVRMEDDVVVAGRACKRIEVIHPEPEVQIDGKKLGFDYHRAVIDMDLELGIPIRYASFLWPEAPEREPLLDEEFTYENLELNCNLTDADFDSANPDYRYPPL